VSRVIHFEIPASNPERILLWVWATSWIFATREKLASCFGFALRIRRSNQAEPGRITKQGSKLGAKR
jgi:hypothetical protein